MTRHAVGFWKMTCQEPARFLLMRGVCPISIGRVRTFAGGATAAGILCGALLVEFLLRFFVVSWFDSTGAIRETRQFTEGVATAHFEVDGLGMYGNRLTGNPVIPEAPLVLIVGDSHVVQDAVPDELTLGAVIERMSRAGGKPVNVRQYGWNNTAAPTYIANAGKFLELDPAKVVVLM